MKKIYALLIFIVLAISCVFAFGSVSAQSISTPSVPEFTVKLIEHPYDVAPTCQIDPYSGENKTIQEGFRVQNRSIEITIENQPFTSFQDSQGNQISLFYNISAKGHYENKWHFYPTWLRTLPVHASDGEHTVLSFGLDVNYEEDNQYGFWFGDLSEGDSVDFRVQALLGYYNDPSYDRVLEDNAFTGEASEWSNTQTLDLPGASVMPSPTVPEVPVLAVLPLFAVIALIAIAVIRKKTSAPSLC